MTTKTAEGKAGGKSAVTRATAGPRISQEVQYRVLRRSQPQPQRPTRGGGKQTQVLLGSTLCEHGVEDLDHPGAPVDENEHGGMALAQARGYTTHTGRSSRAMRRPFLTVRHSRPCQAPVLGRSIPDHVPLIFQAQRSPAGGKGALLTKCKATSCNHHKICDRL